jgi:hypothetical protein
MKTKLLSKLVFATMMAAGAISQVQAQPCSNASLKGTYGFQAFGAAVVSPGSPGTPRAVIGIFTLDGLGKYTANVTVNNNGTVTNTGNQAGTYSVNADCTGTLITTNNGVVTGSVMLVVVDGGKEFYQMRISPTTFVVVGTTKRVSSGENEQN